MSDLMYKGIELMLAGMGTVFFFLSVLVVATTTMSRLVQKFSPEAASKTMAPQMSGVSEDEIAAISVAIQYHQVHNKK